MIKCILKIDANLWHFNQFLLIVELAQEPSEQLDMARAINLLMGTKDLYTSREISNIHRKTARVASQKPLNLKLLPPIN